jgi:integrase
MARPRNPVPTYANHKASGQARARIRNADGTETDVYLGPYNSPESRAAYARLLAELAGPAGVVTSPAADQRRKGGVLVLEVALAWDRFAEVHYRRADGTPTGEGKEFRYAIQYLTKLYGDTPAAGFGPLALQAVRSAMIADGLCRTRINKQVGRLKRVFKWAASQELVPAAVTAALETVDGLRAGRSAAVESVPVGPVPIADYLATLPHLTPTVRAMCEVLRLTGMRPGEVRLMRPCDVEKATPLWTYRPNQHKNKHRGKVRAVPIGPRAQAVLSVYLDDADGPDSRLFTPAKARTERYAEMRARRKSRVTPSQVNRKKPFAELLKRSRDYFSDHGFAAAVRRAAKKAKVRSWHPNQLRHLYGTEVRGLFGLEAAGAALGHTKLSATEVYAERDWGLAGRVAMEMG